MSILFKYPEQKFFPLNAIKLCSKHLSELHHEEPGRFLKCSGFFIVSLEQVYNWVAVSNSDNDQVKSAEKEVDI